MADLDQLIRIGKITSVDEKKHTARVQFTDRDKMVSWDLPVLVPSTVDPQDYCLPVVSIHTPRAGRDDCGGRGVGRWTVSIHTPRAGRDCG